MFTSSILALPRARERVNEASELGVMVSIRMLHQVSLLPLSAQLWDEVFELSRTFFARDDDQEDETQVPESTQGILSLAWASLLAHQYQQHRSTVPDKDQLEHVLQETLAAAERMHSFYHLNTLLRALAFGDTSQDGDHFYPFLQPIAVDVNPVWQLPSVSSLRATSKKLRKERQDSGTKSYQVAIYQHVGADFLDDVIVSLGYLDNAANLHQLNAMVRLVSPVLSNPKIAERSLLNDSGNVNASGNGLAALIQKSKELLPQSLLPCVRLCTALCSNVEVSSPSPVLRQVLKDFGKQLSAEKRSLVSLRLLPPEEYLDSSEEDGKVTCKRSFYYEDDQLSIPEGTVGHIAESSSESKLVQWDLERSDQQRIGLSLWDLIFETMESFVAQVQSDTLLLAKDSDDMEILTSFFEWIVQASRQAEKGGPSIIEEIGCRWTEARLRKWWLDRHLPSPHDVLPLLFSQQVSLAALQDASREDLVAWGIRDRYIREQVLAQLAPSSSLNLPSKGHKVSGRTSVRFEFDGFTHIIRLLFGFLDGFLHDQRAEEDTAWSSKQFHFVSAILGALSALTALDSCLDIIVEELGGGTEECVNLILKSSRKLFEYHERVSGDYPVVLSTLEIVMNLVRWFLSREARSVDQSTSGYEFGGRDFVTAERNWFVGAVEFAVEILSTHESWKFLSIASKWELTDRCFRVIFALLSAKFVSEENPMLQGLQVALRKTMVTDVTLVMKLLRSTCGIVSIRQHQLKNWNTIHASEVYLEGEDFIFPQQLSRSTSPETSAKDEEGLYPLSFECEMNSPVELERLESLAITSLRLIDLLITSIDSSIIADSNASALFLLTPIDDGGPKARKSLNLVTLCGGYLGYPIQKRREVVFWSLKILKHASVFLERSGTSVLDASSHSLAALFQGTKDMALVRDAMLRLLRSSLDEVMVGKELLAFLTTCLEHQPGFLAYLLFDVESGLDSDKKPVKTQRLVAMIERFLVASEQLMEEATELFCEVLNFLLQAWKGATRHNLAVHSQIVDGLRSSANFWKNLTRALKIRMSLEHDDDHVAMDMGLTGDDERSLAHAYVGRSSPYGYLARGYILQIVSYEWHYKGSKSTDHPLTQVLETFRTEGLYSHWLRTFTRLDYSPARFAQVCSYVQHYSKQAQDIITEFDARSDVPSYQEGLICDTTLLQWQLKLATGNGQGIGSAVLKRAKWCNLQSAYVQAQCFSLSRWKVFMELCCFQPGDLTEENSSSSQEPAAGEFSHPPTVNRFKRKESMISSPPRLSTKRAIPASPLDLGVGAKSSGFSGDRTSYGMIQVLSDIIFARQKGEGDSSLDLFGLEHLYHIVELLVSMLHHQLCLVVQKTQDPKFSQTRQRDQVADSRLTVQKCLSLLRLVEKSTQNVELSLEKIKGDFDMDTTMSTPGERSGSHSFWSRLTGDFVLKVDAVGARLRTSLLTASLLLVRHIVTVHSDEPRLGRSGAQSSEEVADPQESAILQVKLVHHCMNSIKLCDQQHDSPALRDLFQVSWSLFQEILDGFVHATTMVAAAQDRRMRLDDFVTLRPLITLLEHEQNGLAALFDILIQRFRAKKKTTNSVDIKTSVQVKQQQALHVLTGLTAVVWNARNRDLCRRVFVDGTGIRLLPLLATQLIPLLRAQMEQEEETTAGTGAGLHGYVLGEGGSHERSIAHQMWCSLLCFAAGLLKLLPANQPPLRFEDASGNNNGVWEFLARSEELMLAALHPQSRLTRARVDEQEAVLRFLNAVSGVETYKKQWKQGLPRNWALLMEQSRLVLRRACVLLGSSLSETKKLQHKQKSGAGKRPSVAVVLGLATSPLASTSSSSVSAFSFAHQTLLHEHLQAVRADEKRHLTHFYRSTESALAESVRQASALLLKWTAGLTAADSMVVVDGVRRIDQEQLLPLLTFTPPSQATSMSCEPCLGHLCVAMDFLVDQLERQDKVASASSSTVDVCGLLFLKTYLLHAELFDHPTADADELRAFFQRLSARVDKLEAPVDRKLLQVIEQVCVRVMWFVGFVIWKYSFNHFSIFFM